MCKPVVDYRRLSLKTLHTEEFRHLKLLLYWPLFGLLFYAAEHLYPVKHYYVMYCRLDDFIPFWELFLIPYLFWFVFMLGMHLYTLLYDIQAFRRMMWFIILTYTAALVIFFLFPTVQHLRPLSFERDNLLTRLVADFYAFDTNTNVCPSLHVTGSLSVLFAAWDVPRFQTRGWRQAFGISAFLISISTVFLKQHSILDVFAALLLCALSYWAVYKRAPNPQRLRRFRTAP